MQEQINSSQDSHFGIPFGGYKQSGIGRELGQYALSAYTQVKAVHGELPTVIESMYPQQNTDQNSQSTWERGCSLMQIGHNAHVYSD